MDAETSIGHSLSPGVSTPEGESLSISVVVPVYNSQDTLPSLISRIEPVLAKCTPHYEIILVNDGSSDGSWGAIRTIVQNRPSVRGVNLMRNYGQHNALLAGIRLALFKWIVTLDDDLQNPPEEIPNLIAHAITGYDVVYGAPSQESHGLMRDIASILTKWMLKNVMGVSTSRYLSAFRIFRTELRDGFQYYHGMHTSIDVLLAWSTTSFGSIIVSHEHRRQGRSNYTLRKLIRHTIDIYTGFTVIPLRIASFIGFLFTLFGLGVLSYVLIRYLTSGSSVQGFPFLASIIAIFSGVQLFALGVIGEYLGRVHMRSQNRPPYTIREEIGETKSTTRN